MEGERRTRKIVTTFIATILMITVIILPTASNLGAYGSEALHTTIYLNPPNYTATTSGEVFTVEVKIANVSSLQAFEFKLGYDTAKLEALEVTEGSFLEGFGETLSPKLETNQTLGFAWVAIILLGTISAEGEGTLATVSFRCTGTGECLFDLYGTTLIDPNGMIIDHYVTDSYSVDEFVDPVTQTQINAAIAKGTDWLATGQNGDGSWGTENQVGTTGFAVLKFETHAIQESMDPLNPGYQYYGQVRHGLDYIFRTASPASIGMQPAGNPDTNGNGVGVYWEGIEGTTYYTGIAMMAVAASKHPEMIVNVAGSAVNGWTYERVLRDAVDYLAFGQTDQGLGRGGWGYGANYGSSDNSNTGYAVLGLAQAEAGFGCTLPSFVRTELNIFVSNIQDPVNGDSNDGGSYYNPDWLPGNPWVNILKTGNLLFEMAFCGDARTTQRVQNAVNYLVRHWNDPNEDPGWKGQANPLTPPFSPSASYQAMYTTMKGLETLGIYEINGIDWFDEFSAVLITQQNLDGSWPPCYWGNSILATEWALLTLQKTVPSPPPVSPSDVAATSVTPSSTLVYEGDSLTISVTVENLGEHNETFNVAAYYGDFPTSAQWDTFWSMGDVNRDGYINLVDYNIEIANFGWHGIPGENPADLNRDGRVNIWDIFMCAMNQGKNIWSYFSIQGGGIGTQTVNSLSPGDSSTLVFTWNTAGLASGDYNIGAYAWPVPGETNVVNNKLADGVVTIKKHYRLTVNTDPLGLAPAPTPASDWYDENTYATETANSVAHYIFVYWDVDGTAVSGNSISVKMDAPHAVTAHYWPELGFETFMTDSSFNLIDHFDTVFTPKDLKKTMFKLASTNPGQFYLNIRITNTWLVNTGSITISYALDNDFVLQPIQGEPIQVWTGYGITGTRIPATVTIGTGGTVTISGLAPGQTVYVTLHMQYAPAKAYYSNAEMNAWKANHEPNIFTTGYTVTVPGPYPFVYTNPISSVNLPDPIVTLGVED